MKSCLSRPSYHLTTDLHIDLMDTVSHCLPSYCARISTPVGVSGELLDTVQKSINVVHKAGRSNIPMHQVVCLSLSRRAPAETVST